MKRSIKVLYSLLISSCVTLIDILHKKIGGFLSGGSYSSSHTWGEIYKMAPEFVGIFVVFFCMSLVYFFLIRREVLFICPRCKSKFSTTNPSEAYCIDCDIEMKNTKIINN